LSMAQFRVIGYWILVIGKKQKLLNPFSVNKS
jgi:hypothetical protein